MEIIKHIKASNILSFGFEGLDLNLGKLNVLIGINGSGKSNFIELFSLLRSLPRSAEDKEANLQRIISKGGGVNEWIWKGAENQVSYIETLMAGPNSNSQNVKHRLTFISENLRLKVIDEFVENERPTGKNKDVYFFYRFQKGKPVLNILDFEGNHDFRGLVVEDVDTEYSILSQRKDPLFYPEIAHVGGLYERIRLYREWSFGRNAPFRESQRADLRNDRLEEDFSNLGVFLNKFGRTPKSKGDLMKSLKRLYEEMEGFEVIIDPGSSSVQVNFSERGFNIPATRLSDGSLRFLCLLSILHDPAPPPFICIEEPEVGLHPDMIPHIADLLLKASERTQLVVTTHSDFLIDTLSKHPETVLVAEKHDGLTTINRLNKEEIDVWLENYSGLGEAWNSGEIGGKRW